MSRMRKANRTWFFKKNCFGCLRDYCKDPGDIEEEIEGLLSSDLRCLSFRDHFRALGIKKTILLNICL